jgi:hypothetical protein
VRGAHPSFPSRPYSCPLFFNLLEFFNFGLTLNDNRRVKINQKISDRRAGSGPDSRTNGSRVFALTQWHNTWKKLSLINFCQGGCIYGMQGL